MTNATLITANDLITALAADDPEMDWIYISTKPIANGQSAVDGYFDLAKVADILSNIAMATWMRLTAKERDRMLISMRK